MPAVYAAIDQDEPRNNLIFDDVLKALEAKRSRVVLTERRDHLEYLQRRFSRFVRNLVVLRGGLSATERKVSGVALRAPEDQERLILATGRYLGEGFDDQRLDTLFPVSYTHLSTHEALDQRNINDASRLAASAANDADILRIDIEECP